MTIETSVFPNDNPKEREGRDGRVRVSERRTWIVTANGEFDSEHNTKREAEKRAEYLEGR